MYRVLRIWIAAFCVALFALLFVSQDALAYDASSTSFYVRQGLQDVTGRSTSTSFGSIFGGGQNALGFSTSTSFQIISGLVRMLYQPVAPTYALNHYHWRNDDGSEATATSATGGAQDTQLTSVAQNAVKRLRIEIANLGGTIKSFSTEQFRLEYASSTSCASATAWANAQNGTEWSTTSTANLTDGANTTNIALATGGVADGNHTFITANGGVKTAGSQTAAVSVPSDSFVELEYAVAPLANATSGTPYCFRVTNAGSTSNFSYTRYPSATVSAASSQSITLSFSPATVALPGLSPGNAVFATSSIGVTISGGTNGYTLKINRNNTTSTLASSTIAFPDATVWNGAGNGSTAPGANFAFRVQQTGTTSNYNSTWWGANDAIGTALFTGTPTSTQTVMNCTTCNAGSSNTIVRYRADSPASQKATSYTGTITFTALANP